MNTKKTTKILKWIWKEILFVLVVVTIPILVNVYSNYQPNVTVTPQWVEDGTYKITIKSNSLLNLNLNDVSAYIVYAVKIRDRKTGQINFCPINSQDFINEAAKSLNLGTLLPYQSFTKQINYKENYYALFNRNLSKVYDFKPFAVVHVSFTSAKNELLFKSFPYDIFEISTTSSILSPIIVSDQVTVDNIQVLEKIQKFPSGNDFCTCSNYQVRNFAGVEYSMDSKYGCEKK